MNQSLKSSGFTLLEVLVAMGILAIGILGVVSLQAISMKLSSGAFLRSQATNLAVSVIDAMRTHGTANYNTGNAFLPSTITDCSNISSSLIGSIAGDRAIWLNQVACTLPSGQGRIDVTGSTVTVRIQWDISNELTQAEQDSGQATTQQLVMTTRL